MVSHNIKVVVNLLQDIKCNEVYEKISKLISYAMTKDKELSEFHEKNTPKMYTFCALYPVQKDGIYKKNNIYTFDIRTINIKFALKIKYLLCDLESEFFKVIMTDITTNKQRNIKQLISLTPTVITSEEHGYFNEQLEFIKSRIIMGAEKKYYKIFGEKVSNDFIESIEKTNIKPIKIPYKNINFLGNKYIINVKQDKISQDLAYILFATGICEKNSLGFGFAKAK